MKKWYLLISILFFCVAAQAQITDIKIAQGKNPYQSLASNVAWAGSGLTGINNAYTWQALSPDTRYCAYIHNSNPTNGHTYTVAAYQTGDPAMSSYSNNVSGEWQALNVYNSGNNTNLGANSTLSYYINSSGSAYVTFVIQGGSTQAGNPDTASVWIVQSNGNSTTCGALAAEPIYCGLTGAITVPAGTTVQLVTANTGNKFVICGWTAGISANGSIDIISGTGPTCGTGTQHVTSSAMPVNTGIPWTVYGGGGQPVYKTSASQSICVAAVTGNVNILFSLQYVQ